MLFPRGINILTAVDTLLAAQTTDMLRIIDIVIPVYGARPQNMKAFKAGVEESYLLVAYSLHHNLPVGIPIGWTSRNATHTPGTKLFYDDLEKEPERAKYRSYNPIPFVDQAKPAIVDCAADTTKTMNLEREATTTLGASHKSITVHFTKRRHRCQTLRAPPSLLALGRPRRQGWNS